MEHSLKNKNKTPWPTKKAMTQIYELGLWGSNNTPFYSGNGSHDPELVTPYIKVVTDFLKSFPNPISVCDLGCGDFNIGSQLYKHSSRYIGIDIVDELIAYNQEQFRETNLSFEALDISRDPLPKADCAIIRQVFQHLSNEEILRVVSKFKIYQYLIVTEHLPEGDFEANKDIISGQGIRLKVNSGVDLLQAPFNLKVRSKQRLLSCKPAGHKGIIETQLLTMY